MKNYSIRTEQGDLITEEEIFHLLYRTLFLIAKQMLDNELEAEDKASEAMTEFLERIEEFTELSQVKEFLYKKVYNDCDAHLQQKDDNEKLKDELRYLSGTEQADLMKEILGAEVIRNLDELKYNLPPRQKKIFDYKCEPDTQDTSWIAKELNIEEQTVRNTKTNTINKLRKALKARGLIPVIIIAAIGIVLYFLC